MARKSAASMQVIQVASNARPKPPRRLNRKEKAVWREIVDSLPSDYFRASDVSLLSSYCRLSVCVEDLSDVITDDPGDLDVIRARNSTVTTLGGMATKLRLCPNARIQNQNVKLQGKTSSRPWDKPRTK